MTDENIITHRSMQEYGKYSGKLFSFFTARTESKSTFDRTGLVYFIVLSITKQREVTYACILKLTCLFVLHLFTLS